MPTDKPITLSISSELQGVIVAVEKEATGVYLPYAHDYEVSEQQRKLHLMSQHSKNGKIEPALIVAKGERK